MDELDNPNNMRLIISRLPYKAREKWRTQVYDIKERRKTRAKFVDLVSFVTREAKLITDPLFGDLHIISAERKEKRTAASENLPKRNKSRGRSFTTNVCLHGKKKLLNSISLSQKHPALLLPSHVCHRFAEKNPSRKFGNLKKNRTVKRNSPALCAP